MLVSVGDELVAIEGAMVVGAVVAGKSVDRIVGGDVGDNTGSAVGGRTGVCVGNCTGSAVGGRTGVCVGGGTGARVGGETDWALHG